MFLSFSILNPKAAIVDGKKSYDLISEDTLIAFKNEPLLTFILSSTFFSPRALRIAGKCIIKSGLNSLAIFVYCSLSKASNFKNYEELLFWPISVINMFYLP